MVLVYTLTALMSAFLLFLVQPMFAKMTLPLLGGTPAVWNTAMVFYQVVLLLGYAYAHFSTKYLNIKKQSILHIGAVVATLVLLPIGVAEIAAPTKNTSHAIWLLGLYTISIGIPFFTLSTIAPLLQKWFSQTNHVNADNPYFLYAASNIGSITALLAYPFWIERKVGLTNQAQLWSFVYGAFALLLIACVIMLFRHHKPRQLNQKTSSAIPSSLKLKWVALAFIPSSLLLSVTTHISTDLASVPLLWIIPLTLFLLTFVIIFSKKPILKHEWMLKIQSYTLIILAFMLYFRFPDFRVNLSIHLAIFFISAMVCHGELAKCRPPAKDLTVFYLYMSIGGALGGFITAIVAPLLFNSVYEYPVGIVLACLARPGLIGGRMSQFVKDIVLPLAVGLFAFFMIRFAIGSELSGVLQISIIGIAYFSCALIVFGFSDRPLRFGAGIASIIILSYLLQGGAARVLDSQRSFFAVHKILKSGDSRNVLLKHGTTIHGVQQVNPDSWKVPISYYHTSGPAGQTFDILNRRNSLQSVGLIGLGLGTLTCYREPDQNWEIFEIDSLVVDIAKDTKYFHFMEQCGHDIPITIGDARLSLEDESNDSFDLLVLDAFSSDSIPIHLLTQEANELYSEKLKSGGMLLIHISNRHMDLSPVIGKLVNLGKHNGRIQFYGGDTKNTLIHPPSVWVALSDNENIFAEFDQSGKWDKFEDHHKIDVWTDDYSNLMEVLK